MLVLRKLIKRIKTIAHISSFTGTSRHPRDPAGGPCRAVRIVKGVSRSRTPCARAASMRTSPSSRRNRTSGRASPTARAPLMEALGGFAIAGALIYGRLPRDRDRGDAGPVLLLPPPRFMLAYEPAKRLAPAQQSISAAGWSGVRILFDVIGPSADRGRPTRTSRRCSSRTARLEFANVQFRLPPGRAGDPQSLVRRRARQGDPRWSGPPVAASRRSLT